MTIALATAWNPRGETSRFDRLFDVIISAYSGIVITLPPKTNPELSSRIMQYPGLKLIKTKDWNWGRWEALESVLEFPVDHIHYVDFDRLIRWIERSLDEWQLIIEKIMCSDYLLIGRKSEAYKTHPNALLETEKISNYVISNLIGKPVDASAGSKGFSRKAVEYIMTHCSPGHALGTDGEWTVALHRAGFCIDYIEVNGLDWESADRYLEKSANSDIQQQAAMIYDSDVNHWSRRVEIAYEIVDWAIRAAHHTNNEITDDIS